ncbi:MAG: hypothetical protein CK425_11365 [Parachlamydia sp.]|nr:MAG: hypothetical protein CK425_11365 [Parachlamydia sp.]
MKRGFMGETRGTGPELNPAFNKTPTFSVSSENNIFKSNKSSAKLKKVAYNIFSTIIFPVGLARLAKAGIGKVAGIFVLPAQFYSKEKLDVERKESIALIKEAFPNISTERKTIETADHVKLDTMEIINEEESAKPPKEQKWVIFMNPNGVTYEELMPLTANYAKDIGANFLTGNYRGVGYSEKSPSKSKDLVMDGEAMLQYLLHEKKIPPENIMIHGWSLGGAVATEVAALHQEKGHAVKVCNERSFSSLYKEIKTLIPGLGPLAAPLAYIGGWKSNPAKAWKSIEEKDKIVIFHKKDTVIDYEASLYKKAKTAKMAPADRALKQKRKKLKNKGENAPVAKTHAQDYKPEQAIRLRREFDVTQNYHMGPLTTAYHSDYLQYIAYAKKTLGIHTKTDF